MIDIPCGIESVEKLSIDAKTGKVEIVLSINNEVVETSRVIFEATVTGAWMEDLDGERSALPIFKTDKGDKQ